MNCYYTNIVAGDTLSALARRFGVTVAQIVAANPAITNPDRIYVGQRVCIPRPVVAGATVPGATTPTAPPPAPVLPAPPVERPPLEITVTGGNASRCPRFLGPLYGEWMEPFCEKWPLVLGGAAFFLVALSLIGSGRPSAPAQAPRRSRRRSR